MYVLVHVQTQVRIPSPHERLPYFICDVGRVRVGVMFCPKVTAKDDHVTPPSAVIDKPRQTWAEYAQSWIDYRKSLTPEPEHVPEADKDTEEYGPEPDYEESQEPEIVRLVKRIRSPP
jgi:hypothetical protein